MSDDLVKRLRMRVASESDNAICMTAVPNSWLHKEAADRIEALEAALAEKEAESAKWCRYAHLYAEWVSEMTTVLWDRKDDLDPDDWEDEKILELLHKAVEVGIVRAALNTPDRKAGG